MEIETQLATKSGAPEHLKEMRYESAGRFNIGHRRLLYPLDPRSGNVRYLQEKTR